MTTSVYTPKFQLEFPKEHGASVAFVVAITFCALIAPRSVLTVLSLASMTGIMLSLNRPLQMLSFAVAGAAVLALLSHSWIVSAPVLIMGAGAYAIESKRIDFGLKQSVGMAAVTLFPLLSATILSSFSVAVLTRSLLFIACTLLSTAIVQVVAKSAAMKPQYSLLPAVAMFASASFFRAPDLLWALLAVPFVVQLLWLSLNKKPSFKMLGIAETLCLLWCAAVLLK